MSKPTIEWTIPCPGCGEPHTVPVGGKVGWCDWCDYCGHLEPLTKDGVVYCSSCGEVQEFDTAGYRPERHGHESFSGSMEKAFADQWAAEHWGGRFPRDLLRMLVCNEPPTLGAAQHEHECTPITERERRIAGTLMQWLGTNVGRCFLMQALARAGATINWNYERAPDLPESPHAAGDRDRAK